MGECQHNWNYGDDIRWCPGCGATEKPKMEVPAHGAPRPACGQGLLLVEGSTMLVCSNKDTDPLFLI